MSPAWPEWAHPKDIGNTTEAWTARHRKAINAGETHLGNLFQQDTPASMAVGQRGSQVEAWWHCLRKQWDIVQMRIRLQSFKNKTIEPTSHHVSPKNFTLMWSLTFNDPSSLGAIRPAACLLLADTPEVSSRRLQNQADGELGVSSKSEVLRWI